MSLYSQDGDGDEPSSGQSTPKQVTLDQALGSCDLSSSSPVASLAPNINPSLDQGFAVSRQVAKTCEHGGKPLDVAKYKEALELTSGYKCGKKHRHEQKAKKPLEATLEQLLLDVAALKSEVARLRATHDRVASLERSLASILPKKKMSIFASYMIDRARYILIQAFLRLEFTGADGKIVDYGQHFKPCYNAKKGQIVWSRFRTCLVQAHSARFRTERTDTHDENEVVRRWFSENRNSLSVDSDVTSAMPASDLSESSSTTVRAVLGGQDLSDPEKLGTTEVDRGGKSQNRSGVLDMVDLASAFTEDLEGMLAKQQSVKRTAHEEFECARTQKALHLRKLELYLGMWLGLADKLPDVVIPDQDRLEIQTLVRDLMAVPGLEVVLSDSGETEASSSPIPTWASKLLNILERSQVADTSVHRPSHIHSAENRIWFIEVMPDALRLRLIQLSQAISTMEEQTQIHKEASDTSDLLSMALSFTRNRELLAAIFDENDFFRGEGNKLAGSWDVPLQARHDALKCALEAPVGRREACALIGIHNIMYPNEQFNLIAVGETC